MTTPKKTKTKVLKKDEGSKLSSICFNVLNRDNRGQNVWKTYGGTIGFRDLDENEGFGTATVIAIDPESDGQWKLQTSQSLTEIHQMALAEYNKNRPDGRRLDSIEKMVVKITDDRGKFASKVLHLREKMKTNIQVTVEVQEEDFWFEEYPSKEDPRDPNSATITKIAIYIQVSPNLDTLKATALGPNSLSMPNPVRGYLKTVGGEDPKTPAEKYSADDPDLLAKVRFQRHGAAQMRRQKPKTTTSISLKAEGYAQQEDDEEIVTTTEEKAVSSFTPKMNRVIERD